MLKVQTKSTVHLVFSRFSIYKYAYKYVSHRGTLLKVSTSESDFFFTYHYIFRKINKSLVCAVYDIVFGVHSERGVFW